MTREPSRAANGKTPLTRFLLHHLLGGTVGALVFLGAILATDYAGIASMIAASEDGALYLLLLFFGLWATFGGVAMAVGVMRARD